MTRKEAINMPQNKSELVLAEILQNFTYLPAGWSFFSESSGYLTRNHGIKSLLSMIDESHTEIYRRFKPIVVSWNGNCFPAIATG